MWADDAASRALGMDAASSSAPGRAVVSMPVRPDMVNGHDRLPRRAGRVPGRQRLRAGLQLPRRATVAGGFDITFLEPAHERRRTRRHRRRARPAWPLRHLRRHRAPRRHRDRRVPGPQPRTAIVRHLWLVSRGDRPTKGDGLSRWRRGRIGDVAVSVEFSGLTKRFGSLTAVDDLSFVVAARARHRIPRAERRRQDDDAADAARAWSGPTSGTRDHRRPRVRRPRQPLAIVGAALEATDVHPGRSGRDHLRVMAAVPACPTAGSTSCSS